MDRDDNEGMSFTEFSYQVRTLLPIPPSRSDGARKRGGGWWLVGLTNGEQRDGWMDGWAGTRCCRATTS
jgi:hypothetical protein